MQRKSFQTAELDALVATYAPIGVSQRRRKLQQRALLMGGCTLIAALIALVAHSYASILQTITTPAPTSGSVALNQDEIARLDREREMFASRLAELEKQITGVHGQKHELELQQAEIREQTQRLALLLDEADLEQKDLEVKQRHGSKLDEEIQAIAAQREALAKRWEQFEAQGELLAMEIRAVNAQRKELESQRRQIDQQQRELAELLDRAEGLYRRAAGSVDDSVVPESTSTATDSDDSFTYTYNSLVADANDLVVDNGNLDKMRGGFSIGDGLDVSFGYTQTGAINGVEQFNNSFSIDSMASGIDGVDMSNMNSVVLQNGTGNFVGPDVLDSLATSFGSIIQNTLDDQVISTTTIYDISLHNVPGTLQGVAGEQALMDSLGSFR